MLLPLDNEGISIQATNHTFFEMDVLKQVKFLYKWSLYVHALVIQGEKLNRELNISQVNVLFKTTIIRYYDHYTFRTEQDGALRLGLHIIWLLRISSPCSIFLGTSHYQYDSPSKFDYWQSMGADEMLVRSPLKYYFSIQDWEEVYMHWSLYSTCVKCSTILKILGSRHMLCTRIDT